MSINVQFSSVQQLKTICLSNDNKQNPHNLNWYRDIASIYLFIFRTSNSSTTIQLSYYSTHCHNITEVAVNQCSELYHSHFKPTLPYSSTVLSVLHQISLSRHWVQTWTSVLLTKTQLSTPWPQISQTPSTPASLWTALYNHVLRRITIIITSCRQAAATICPRSSPPPWAPKRRRQRSSSFPRPTRSHAQRCSRLTR